MAVVVDELSYGVHSRDAEILSAILGRTAPIPIIAATSAMILMEGVRNILVLSNYLHNRFVKPLIEKRRQEMEERRQEMEKRLAESTARGMAEGMAQGMAQGRAEGMTQGRAEGMTQGRAQIHAEWSSWNQRRLEAEINGQPFTEPPPAGPNGSSPTSR